ncbi:MAG: hypothetical protein WCJ85_04440 [Chitinophagaceae bacterium]
MIDYNNELITDLNRSLSKDWSVEISLTELENQLADYVNLLILKDFEKLVALLYRIDVPEQKLKLLLLELANEDAGKIIASLIIERQLQKIKARKEFSKKTDDFEEEEKW